MGKIQALETGFSMLRKVPKEKINPKALGWIRPDGAINFATKEAAETYAKNRVVAPLNIKTPFERGVLYKDTLIIGEVNGTQTAIDTKSLGDMADCIFVHGHPRGKGGDAPISLTDYITMNSQNAKKIIAYNKDGEYSSLTRKEGKNFLIKILPKKLQEKCKFWETLGNGTLATERYAKGYADLFPKDLQKMVDEAIHVQIGIPYGNTGKIKAHYKRNGIPRKEYISIQKVENQVYTDGSLFRMIHDFWKKTAKTLNCEYTTNFSGLV